MGQAPGPTGREMIRLLPQLNEDPLRYLSGLSNRYGDLLRVPLPRGGQIFIASRPELVAHVLVANQANYRKARTYKPLTELLGNGLLTNEGDSWTRQRRIVQPMFARRHLDGFAPAMVAAAQRTVEQSERLAVGAVVDAAAEMSALTLDVVGRTLFSADLTGEANTVSSALATALGAFEKIVRNPMFLLVQNYHRWPTPNRLRARGAEKQLHRIVGELVGRRREENADPGERDLLDMLLVARDEDTGEPMDQAQIRDELMTFMLAGHETTSNALAWTLMLLSQHPGARARLEEEVDGVLSGRAVTADDVNKLEWTSAVISESMRLYPPAWIIEREAAGDDELDGVPVRAGSVVATPPYLVHRHPAHWTNPEGFDPERFLPEQAHGRHRFAYLPFGGGRRQCVGGGFATMEAVLLLATLVQRFRLDLVPGFRPAPDPTVTLRPAAGIPMRVHPR